MKSYNTSLFNWAQRIFNLRSDSLSSEVGENIIPVVNITPTINIARGISSSVTGSSTVYTTPTDKDFYLTNITMELTCDSTADLTSVSITVTVEGVSRSILVIPKQSLTAVSNLTNSLNLQTLPLKLDKGTNVLLNKTFTVGTMTGHVQMFGYTVEINDSNYRV